MAVIQSNQLKYLGFIVVGVSHSFGCFVVAHMHRHFHLSSSQYTAIKTADGDLDLERCTVAAHCDQMQRTNCAVHCSVEAKYRYLLLKVFTFSQVCISVWGTAIVIVKTACFVGQASAGPLRQSNVRYEMCKRAQSRASVLPLFSDGVAKVIPVPGVKHLQRYMRHHRCTSFKVGVR